MKKINVFFGLSNGQDLKFNNTFHNIGGDLIKHFLKLLAFNDIEKKTFTIYKQKYNLFIQKKNNFINLFFFNQNIEKKIFINSSYVFLQNILKLVSELFNISNIYKIFLIYDDLDLRNKIKIRKRTIDSSIKSHNGIKFIYKHIDKFFHDYFIHFRIGRLFDMNKKNYNDLVLSKNIQNIRYKDKIFSSFISNSYLDKLIQKDIYDIHNSSEFIINYN